MAKESALTIGKRPFKKHGSNSEQGAIRKGAMYRTKRRGEILLNERCEKMSGLSEDGMRENLNEEILIGTNAKTDSVAKRKYQALDSMGASGGKTNDFADHGIVTNGNVRT